MYGGCPIQWESKQQAFGTLSTSESELLGYTDAMVLGESVTSVLDILEGNKLSEEGDKVLMGTINQVSVCLRALTGHGALGICAFAVLF